MTWKYKKYLRYHRVVVVFLVFTAIVIRYSMRENKSLYENGQVKVEGRRSGGYNEGTWTWYFNNGNIRMQGNFEKSKRTGVWKVWNEKGILMSIRNYEKDKLNGYFSDYYNDGKIKTEGSFVKDKLEGAVKHFANDSLKEIQFYKNGIFTGSQKP